jgi:aminoglycoside phosphotransferase (APT) family kinase protein
MATEAALLRAAAAAGVPVPDVLLSGGGDEEGIGAPFILMERIDGETIPRRILREPSLANARERLVTQCAHALAGIQRIPVEAVPTLPHEDPLAQYSAVLATHQQPHPTFELALRWLKANRPPASPTCIVHGDFRNGNLVVGPEGLRVVLDWELAHLGDPLEDLGWLCVRAWRFGSPRAVGGFGDVDALIDAYAQAAGVRVDAEALHWWEVMGTLRWGAICIIQMERHLSGGVRSVELAAIGRRVCEVEWDLLLLLYPQSSSRLPVEETTVAPRQPFAPHDPPTATELLEAVREYLSVDVASVTEGQVRFHARVAANVLGMVERELALGASHAAIHAARMRRLGVADEAGLALAIRDGALDDRLDEVVAAVRETVREKLLVANPDHLTLP